MTALLEMNIRPAVHTRPMVHYWPKPWEVVGLITNFPITTADETAHYSFHVHALMPSDLNALR